MTLDISISMLNSVYGGYLRLGGRDLQMQIIRLHQPGRKSFGDDSPIRTRIFHDVVVPSR